MLYALTETSPQYVIITNPEGHIVYVNPAFEAFTGYSKQEVLGQTPRLLKSGIHDAAFYVRLWTTVLAGRPFRAVFTNRKKDGSLYQRDQTIFPVHGGERGVRYLAAVGRDVSEEHRLKVELRRLSISDPLTGTMNRRAFFERGYSLLTRAREGGVRAALVFIDLNDFKRVNDALGHAAGDRALIEVVRRIEDASRSRDLLARVGGDELAWLLFDVDERGVHAAASRLRGAFKHPFLLPNPFYLTVSLGIACFPGNGETLEKLVKKADTAMYQAKLAWKAERAGEGEVTLAFFDSEQEAREEERTRLEAALQRTLAEEGLEAFFQPLLDLQTGKIYGFEALCRWPEKNLPPSVFLPIALDAGLMPELDRFMLRKAVAALRYLPGTISVNLSKPCLYDPSFPFYLHTLLKHEAISPSRLCLEVVEREFLEPERIFPVLRRLKAENVQLSLDDFGTGFSSLAYLKQYPFDQLKLPREFIQGLDEDPRDQALAQAVVTLARGLGLGTVAEGLETKAGLDWARELGYTLAQGYSIAKPAPLEEALRWLEKRREA